MKRGHKKDMEFRRAKLTDYPGLYDLQNRNLRTVLTPGERADGSLSAGFTQEEFKALNDDLCVVVCAERQKVLGFLVASTIEFNKHFALSGTMIACYPRAKLDGRPLDSYCSYISGPVCVEGAQRGKGIFEGMYRRLFELLPAKYDLAVTLVAKDNPRSLSAHAKVGFEQVDQFRFNGRVFYILARKI